MEGNALQFILLIVNELQTQMEGNKNNQNQIERIEGYNAIYPSSPQYSGGGAAAAVQFVFVWGKVCKILLSYKLL